MSTNKRTITSVTSISTVKGEKIKKGDYIFFDNNGYVKKSDTPTKYQAGEDLSTPVVYLTLDPFTSPPYMVFNFVIDGKDGISGKKAHKIIDDGIL